MIFPITMTCNSKCRSEPTLRKDLPELVAKLVDVCPRLESLSLNSSAARAVDGAGRQEPVGV